MTQETVLGKVKKLLKLGQSPNANESAAAIAKAQSLMDQHKISEAMLDLDGQTNEPEEDIRDWEEPLEHKGGSRWKGVLATVLARANGCQVYQTRGVQGTPFKIIGKVSNVQAVRYLYSYCQREIRSLTKEVGRGNGRRYANNFKLGCVDAIDQAIAKERDRMRAQFRSEADSSRALMVVNNAIQKVDRELVEAEAFGRVKLNLRSRSRQYKRNDPSAREHGRQAGADIYPGQGGKTQIGGSQKQIGD